MEWESVRRLHNPYILECHQNVDHYRIINRRWSVSGVLHNMLGVESFQLEMRISFLLLLSKDLHTPLLIMRTGSFFTPLYVGDTYTRLVYTLYKTIFRMIAVLIVFLAVNEKRNTIKIISNRDSDETETRQCNC